MGISERLRLHPRVGGNNKIRAEGAARILGNPREGAAHILGNPRRRRGSYFHFFEIMVLPGSRLALILFAKAKKRSEALPPKKISSF